MAGSSRRKFKVLRGFDYDDGRRQFEPGDVVTSLPSEFVGWMLAEGIIAEHDDQARPTDPQKGA